MKELTTFREAGAVSTNFADIFKFVLDQLYLFEWVSQLNSNEDNANARETVELYKTVVYYI